MATGFMHTLGGLPVAELLPYLYNYTQEEAVRHLFRVASGLDSMIVGEYEILGQVRRCLEEAESTRMTPSAIVHLFEQAVAVGRRVRDETRISRNAASVSSVAVEMAKKTLGDLSSAQVLVIGAGEAGRLAAQALVGRGVAQIVVASRSYETAARLAEEMGSGAIAAHSISEALATADIVVACSNSPHYVLEHWMVGKAMELRPRRPMVIIDIAVPRDVAADVGDVEEVSLYDIDGLSELSEANRQERSKEIEAAEQIVQREVVRFMGWWHSIGMAPTIAALVKKAEDIRKERLERTLRDMGDLSEEEMVSLEEMTKSIVRRILHDPILCLKRSNGSQFGPVIREVFNLSDDLEPGEESVEQK
jgi:glutamyl-tRNA reductase